MRRWYKIKKSQWKRSSIFSNKNLQDPITLIDFSRTDDAVDIISFHVNPSNDRWRLSDDGVIGGYSTGVIKCLKEKGAKMNKSSSKINTFIRWMGVIDTRVGTESRATRSGYCALQSPDFPFGVSLDRNYNALEITCRPDERTYTVNLKISSYFPDDLYQGVISLNKSTNSTVLENSKIKCSNDENYDNNFIRFILPFQDFILTSSGLVREQQRYLDGNIVIQHIGFVQMDGQNGPFLFDLKKIRAVNYYQKDNFAHKC